MLRCLVLLFECDTVSATSIIKRAWACSLQRGIFNLMCRSLAVQNTVRHYDWALIECWRRCLISKGEYERDGEKG